MLWVAPYAPPRRATASPLTSPVVMKSAARALTASPPPPASKSAHRSHPPARNTSMPWVAPYAPQPWALTNQWGVRPSQVDNSNGCKPRAGKGGHPPGSNHRAGGGNSKC